MKKMKKLFAILMTMAMVMGLGITGFAAENVPDESDSVEAIVQNVEYNAIVTAYQIVKGSYNTFGLTGYEVVDGEVGIANPLSPTAEELASIAKDEDLLKTLPSKTMTTNATEGLGTFTADLEAGYWLILVTGDATHDIKEVYNPMLLGVYYNVSGSVDTLYPDPVNANDNWVVDSNIVYAKSSDIPFTKTANAVTADLGDTIKYEIVTTIPYYSDEYDTNSLQFVVNDSLTNLELKVDNEEHKFQVQVEETEGNYTDIDSDYYQFMLNDDVTNAPETGDKAFEVSFVNSWIKTNGGKEIKITYYATLEEGALNNVAGDNDASVTYTNDPSNQTDAKTDEQKVYTFDIDGDVTANILKKVAPGQTGEENVVLPNAVFTLYTDASCSTPYNNAKHTDGTSTSDTNGQIEFTGLAEGTYYLKETAAPNGYTLNNTVYKIDIDANIQDEELINWTVKVMPVDGDPKEDTATSTFTVSGGIVKNVESTEILNTTLTALPSTGGMGTTLFTIAGCVIMISAAGLFFATRKKAN